MVSCYNYEKIIDFQIIIYVQIPKFSSLQLLCINNNIKSRMIQNRLADHLEKYLLCP